MQRGGGGVDPVAGIRQAGAVGADQRAAGGQAVGEAHAAIDRGRATLHW